MFTEIASPSWRHPLSIPHASPTLRNNEFLFSYNFKYHTIFWRKHFLSLCWNLVSAWSLNCVRLFATPCTAARQTPLSTGILQASIAMEWVAMLFSRESSQQRNQSQVSHTAGVFCTVWAIREAKTWWTCSYIFIKFMTTIYFLIKNNNVFCYFLFDWYTEWLIG